MLSQVRKRIVFGAFITAAVGLLVLNGCDSNRNGDLADNQKQLSESALNSSTNAKDSIQSETIATDTSTEIERAPVEIKTAYANLISVNFEQWSQIKQENIPNIVVVDMWASWCIPCLERFPAMVEMSEKYGPKGVQFLSLSLDDREDQASLEFADQFLSKQQANFPHYFLDENILDGFELLDLQTVPAVDIFNRDGKLLVRLTGDNPNKQFTEHDIERQLQQLLL